MSPWLLSLSVAMIACASACGSRGPIGDTGSFGDGDSDTSDDDAPRPNPSSGGSSTTPATNAGRGGTASSSNDSQDALPPCMPGPALRDARQSGFACNWLVDGRCYDARIAACACACPRDRDSTCVSGSPGSEVRVSCL